MRNIFAIGLLLLLGFTLFGYQLVYHWAETKATRIIEKKIEKEEVDETELVTFSVPLSLPYYSDNQNFETASGEINIKGTIYRYVKKRICQNRADFVCIVHKDKMQLQNARDNFFNLVNDYASQKENSKPAPHQTQLKLFSFECDHLPDYSFSGNSVSSTHTYQAFISPLLNGCGRPLIKPPVTA